jgi:hypothetical protein
MAKEQKPVDTFEIGSTVVRRVNVGTVVGFSAEGKPVVEWIVPDVASSWKEYRAEKPEDLALTLKLN